MATKMREAKVLIDRTHKPTFIVQINRPEVRNAVDGETARLLHDAFIDFAEDDEVITLDLRRDG
jgi:enoyl-CoA hydratase